MEIFRLKYDWYEGDSGETWLGKNVSKEKFEEDLKESREFAKSLLGKSIEHGDYLGRGYSVECLPEFYEQIVWFLINKLGYVECSVKNFHYSIDDFSKNKITIERIEEEIKRTAI